MKKILVSWIATNHDFLKRDELGEMKFTDKTFNEDGPHFSLYKDFGDDFDIHYLLCQDDENNSSVKWSKLAGSLRHRFKKQVILKFMSIDDVFSVGTIKGKVEDFIKYQLKDMDVEVFISPGTPAMQTAWYLLASELSNRTNLTFFKRRERKFMRNNSTPKKEIIRFEKSKYANYSNIRDNFRNESEYSISNTLITKSLKNVYERGFKLAGNNNTTVLISGNFGVGKTHLARYIHENSNRKNRNLITINCSSYNEEILQGILFGIEPGAFNGATKLKTGVFEQCKGGTLLLKEINILPLRIQAKLCEVLINKKISRLGSFKEIGIDVRVIATSTENLKNHCENGFFRWDLYYRLSIAELKLLPFFSMDKNERKDWVNYFLETTYTKLETRFISKIDKDVWIFLLDQPFKRNILELSNLIETLYTFCDDKISMTDIFKSYDESQNLDSIILEEIIINHIKKVVNFCGGNISEASRKLGIDRATVKKYIKKLT